MEFIKKPEKISNHYLQKLRKFIKIYGDRFFVDHNEADSEDDFEFFKTIKTDRDHLVKYGEVLMVDLEYGEDKESWYCIAQHTKRKYKLCSGRKVNFRILRSVIKTSELKFWKAGYWLLPKLI